MPCFQIRELHPRLQASLVSRRLDRLGRPHGRRHWPRWLLLGCDQGSCAVDDDGSGKDARNAHELHYNLEPNLIRDRVKTAGIIQRRLGNPQKTAWYGTWSRCRRKDLEVVMKTGKTSAATLGLVGGVVLGAVIGSTLTTSRASAPEPPAVTTEAVQESPAATAPAKPKRVTHADRVARAAASAVGAPTPESTPRLVMTIPVSAP